MCIVWWPSWTVVCVCMWLVLVCDGATELVSVPSGINKSVYLRLVQISFIPYSNVSSPTDWYSQSLTTLPTAVDDSTWLCSPLYTRSTWPTSQTGGLPWMPALAESATFQTKSHARVADGRIQPAQVHPGQFSVVLVDTSGCHVMPAVSGILRERGRGRGMSVTLTPGCPRLAKVHHLLCLSEPTLAMQKTVNSAPLLVSWRRTWNLALEHCIQVNV